MPEAVKGDFMEEGDKGWTLTSGQGWTAEAKRYPQTPNIRCSPGHDGCLGQAVRGSPLKTGTLSLASWPPPTHTEGLGGQETLRNVCGIQ